MAPSSPICRARKKVSGDALLYAVGRQGIAIDDLNLAAAGIEGRRSRGRIPVNENYQTNIDNIYAAGDVVGFPSLASVSMEQGRIAAARAFNDTHTTSNPSFYPYGIYTIPEISFIGKTEEQLTDEDVPYEVGMAFYRETARGQIRGDTTGRLKLIFHRDTRKVPGRPHHWRRRQANSSTSGQAVMIMGGPSTTSSTPSSNLSNSRRVLQGCSIQRTPAACTATRWNNHDAKVQQCHPEDGACLQDPSDDLVGCGAGGNEGSAFGC